jgi:hypothetical protein
LARFIGHDDILMVAVAQRGGLSRAERYLAFDRTTNSGLAEWMPDLPRYTHRTVRTVKLSPAAYELQLSTTIFGILNQKIHDLNGIVAALNNSPVRPPDGQAWTEASFNAEMERLGAYPNSVGAPIGAHPVGVIPPGTSARDRLTKATDEAVDDR